MTFNQPMRRIAFLSFASLLPLSAAVAEVNAVDDFPGLPVTAVNQVDAESPIEEPAVDAGANAEEPAEAASSTTSVDAKDEVDKAETVQTARNLSLKPGVNEVITIAVSHTNRIVLPFDSPRIRTTSNAGFDVEGNAVYVTSHDEGRPVTAFISQAGEPELALSVTFVPSRIPPVEITLDIDSEHLPKGIAHTRSAAKSWEESQPYIVTLRALLREVAVGKTPSGYALNENPDQAIFNGCFQQGLEFDFSNGQRLEGHRLMVNVGVVENVTAEIIEFREPSCAVDEVKAVAAWPRPILKPGEKSEVYVVLSIPHQTQTPYNVRRSLIEE